jgi:hypothetical protein
MQYNTFNLTFELPGGNNAPAALTKDVHEKIKKIDEQPNNACIQFFAADKTAITPVYEAKYYNTGGKAVVYVNWRYVRPGQGDLNVTPKKFFEKSEIAQDDLLNFSKQSTLDLKQKDQKYIFKWDKRPELAKKLLKEDRESWSKGIFLAIYEQVDVGGQILSEGKCEGYVKPKSSKGATLFEKTSRVYFDLYITKGDNGYDINLLLKTEDATTQADSGGQAEKKGKAARPKKQVGEVGEVGEAEGAAPEPKADKKKQKKKISVEEKPEAAESEEALLESFFKRLHEASTTINSKELDGKQNFVSLGWKYQPRTEYTITIDDGDPKNIYAEIRAKLDELEETAYAADLKAVLDGKKIYELTPQQRNYKYALDALLSRWLSDQTQTQDMQTK